MSELIKVADAWEKQRRGNNPGTYIVGRGRRRPFSNSRT
jgi:hypothetical protein